MREPPPIPERPRRSIIVAAALAVLVAVVAAGCGSTSQADKATEQQKAEQLVTAAHAAGVAPHLTAGVAKSLYGTDAPGVCKVFEGGLTTAEKNDLLGNNSGRRPKAITTDAVTYGRVVVQTYCPDELSRYNDEVKDLNAVKSTSS